MRDRILIIDDDQDILRGTALRFRRSGYDVSPARSGKAGVRVASATCPSAIVLDVCMPGMDGMEVLQKLKTQQSTRNIPVVMLSASVSDEKISLDAGAEYFLKKPYDGKMLIATVRSAMNRASRAPIGSAS